MVFFAAIFSPYVGEGRIYHKRKPPAATPRAFHIAREAFATERLY
jgi:hypothetical protein